MVEKPHAEISQKNRIITILGPTASGKTTRAVDMAKCIDAEIISADSRQVYKEMDLGTGKDLDEYNGVPYHLIDICEAGEKYNLHKYLKDFQKVLKDIKNRGKETIVCGGSGMYLENALCGLNLPEVPENSELRKNLEGMSLPQLTELLKRYKTLHNKTDVDTTKRAIRAIEIEEYYKTHPQEAINADRQKTQPLDSLIIGIDVPRDIRRKRISMRLRKRLDEGMVEEVQSLLDKGVNPDDLIYYGLEYKFLTLFLIGNLSYNQMMGELEIAIHQFAKRQMTWFRGMEKRGFKINWLPYDLPKDIFVEKVLTLRNEGM